MASIFRTRGHLDPKRDANIFVPRPEGATILKMIREDVVAAYVALLGSRQTGKTSLLYYIRAALRQTPGYVSALVDLSPLDGQKDEAECYRYICRELLTELAPVVAVTEEDRYRLLETTGPIAFRLFLSEVAKKTPQARITILLDEIGALQASIGDHLFSVLRSIFSSKDKEGEREFQKYFFVFAGAVDLFHLTAGQVSPLNICERIYLTDLDLSGVKFLLDNFADLRVQVDPGVAEGLYAWTGGHPYLSQRLCAVIEGWMSKSKRRRRIIPATVDAAATEVLSGDDHLAHLLGQLSRDAEAFAWLRRFMQEDKKVRFSRVSPVIARLELIGAIKNQDGFCALRNRIYEETLRSYLEQAATATAQMDVEALRRLLDIHRRNLFQLEETRAKLGLEAPPSLINRIADEEAAIKRLAEQLGEER